MSTTCIACGQPLALDAAFCIGCGQPAPRWCTLCGGPVSVVASWCGTCGAKVAGADAASAGAATQPLAPPPPAPQPSHPSAVVGAVPLTVAGRPSRLIQSARRRPVLVAGAAVAVVAVLVATTVFGARLPWSTASIPLVETPMQAATIIDVATDNNTLAIAPGQENRLGTEGAALVIPAGAASPNTRVTVKVLQEAFNMTQGPMPQDGEANAVAIGPVVDFRPEGTTFNEPVTISVPYDHTFLPAGMSEDSIRPAYWNGQSWVVVSGLVDKNADTVSVKLKDFKGVAVLAVVVGAVMVTAVGVALKRTYDSWGELKWSDPVTRGTAKEYVTPNNPIVQMYAGKAVITDGNTHTQMALDDPKMPAWLAKASQDSHNMNLGYVDQTGKVTQPAWDEAKGSNWQKPDDFFLTGDANGPLHGDCTDDANSSVSVFIASGFQAKGVFGRDVKDGAVHAWAEVSIGGKPYKMDAAGIYSPERWTSSGLPTYVPDTWGRHYDSMWDDQGQKPYDKDWWKKNALSASVVTTNGMSATLKASATGLPSTSKKAMLSWDFGAGPEDYKTFTAPFAEPLVSNVTHAFADKGSYPVTVILYDTSSGSQVELSRVTISVQIGAPSPSPSASPSAFASTSAHSSASAGDPSKGYWQFVETKNFPDVQPVVKTDYDVTADGGHFSRVVSRPDEKPATWAFSCTWSISSPTDPDRLAPGSSVEGTASCTDTSDAVGFYSSGVSFAIEPLGIPGYDGGTWGPAMTFGLRETKTLKGSLIVPAGPRASAPWNGQMCVQFQMSQVGFTQRIYKWVPGGA